MEVKRIQEFLNYHKYLSNSTIDKLYHKLGSTFKIAINKGYLTRNPMINVLKPKSNKLDKEVRALTLEEQQLFTDYLLNKDISNCKYKNVYLIQMYLGLRCGETLALTTHDIDLKNKRLYVKRTLTKYYERVNVNTELKRLLKRHFGIEDITTHSLRHTYGTRCIEAGMAPVVVQRLMGHKDISVTLNTYTSVFDAFKEKEKEIDKVNKYYLEENMLNAVKMLQEYDTKEDVDNEIRL